MKTRFVAYLVAVCCAGACFAQVPLAPVAPTPPAQDIVGAIPGAWTTNMVSQAPGMRLKLGQLQPSAAVVPRNHAKPPTNGLAAPYLNPGQPLFRSDKGADRLTGSQNQPLPGLYKSEPYTCLVLVPGPHPDDKALAPAAPVTPRMPQMAPDFRLVPRPSPAPSQAPAGK